ncbi:MAG: hypothetical protein IT230_12230 [Flavobacteriales bacterium]|nr:hypothetical protein [Flavobacteriales bacterium]
MKTAILLLATALCHAVAAQWSTNPDAPTVLCNEPGEQTYLIVRPDGTGGWYALWLDERADPDKAQLYGQHILEDGSVAWEPAGRPLIGDALRAVQSHTFNFFANGDIGVLYTTSITGSADSVHFMRFDAEGSPLWDTPVHVGGYNGSTGNAYDAWRPLMLVQADGSVLVSWMHEPQNTNGRMAFGKIGADGSLPWGYNALVFSSSGYGHSAILPDGSGGLFAAWSSSNAWGAPVYVQRILANGTIGWEAPVPAFNVATGEGSNEFRVALGADNSLLLAGPVADDDLNLTRIFTDGTAQYNDLCVAANAQRRPSLSLTADALFVTWQDNRNGSPSSSFVQKLALDGTPLWPACGVPAITLNNYIPHPKVAGLPDGGAIITQQVTASPQGMRAQRLDANGNTLWTTPVRFTDHDLSAHYGSYTVLATADNGVAAFWITSDEDLYMAHITPDGGVGMSTTGIATATITGPSAFPVPTEDHVELRGEGLSAGQVPVLFALDGRPCAVPMRFTGQAWHLDLSTLADGLYLARMPQRTAVATVRVVKQ